MSNASADAGLEILIAEDSPTQSLRLQNTLHKNGFRVTAAANGRLALDKLVTLRPALVISDIQMPEMDGYELCRSIKTDAALKEIPVMLLTSLSAPQDIIHGLECGADNFVVKPYEDEFLLSRVRTILANRSLPAAHEGEGIPIFFAGRSYRITSDRRQILNLLLSTYETAVKTNLELIKTHEALKAAQAQLIEAEKLQSVGRLAAGVAHEVRNPLAIMEMGLGFLGDTVGEDGQVILGEMKEAVTRANGVISGLMDLSTPRELGMQQLNLNEAVQRALTALHDEISLAKINVVTELAPDLPLSSVDTSKIEQVFINVISNAVHAMPQGGTLTIRSFVKKLETADVAFEAGERGGAWFREGESVIVFEVRDTGTGIAPENLGKLFEPFFSTKPTGKGMGLGLTVAKKIVDLHRGRIEVRNADGGGAIATLLFKIA